MGKRKRNTDTKKNPSSSDNMGCSSGAELLPSKKVSHLQGSGELKHHSPGKDVTDRCVKLLNAHQHYNVGRSVFLKRSRHYYGHHYSRRNSGNHPSASTSHGRNASLQDEKLPFKLTAGCGPEFGHHTDNRGKSFGRSDRIKFSSLIMNSSDVVKMICGICQKLLQRKPYFLGDTLSSGERSIVAVLVCGHVYHAGCLEQRTSLEERHDPPCPLCSGLLSVGETSRQQE